MIQLTPELRRHYKLRRIAKDFASKCRRENLAFKLDEELLDKLSDEEALELINKHLPEAGLQRSSQIGSSWERK